MTTRAKKKRKLTVSSGSSINEIHPYRNIENLYASETTVNCALGLSAQSSNKPCIPCAYKVATPDIALDHEFTQIVRNTRPELCPRSKASFGTEGILGYTRGMKMLTIGDGDFTFSLALARLFHKAKTENTRSGDNEGSISIVATSYESLKTLQTVYPSINATIAELKKYKYVQIAYEVDATNLLNTLPNNIKQHNFHRIVWNFPCTAESNGQDGQNDQMDQNKKLVEKFVHNCIQFMDETSGEIQILHKTKPPYCQWKIEQVALNGWRVSIQNDVDDDNNSNEQNSACPLEYKGRIAFDKCILPPYVPRKALDKKSFPCHDACLYIFGWREQLLDETKNDSSCGNLPATIQRQKDNDIDEGGEEDDTIPSKYRIIPVDKKMIDKIRKVHLLYAKTNVDKKSKERRKEWKGCR